MFPIKLFFLTAGPLILISFISATVVMIWVSSSSQFSTLSDVVPSGIVVQKNGIGRSCLNDVYDEIFVISIRSRIETLSITLHQLNEEHISYTFWTGHSANNTYSVYLWNTFKSYVDADSEAQASHFIKHKNSAYQTKNIFFLRQTQIDILKYAQKHNLSKILIFEDDILLANPYWIHQFCLVEHKIPEWYALNIGVNQNVRQKKHTLNLQSIANSSEITYFKLNRFSYGAYGISFSYPMYQILIQLFDVHLKVTNLYPLDSMGNHFKTRNISGINILSKCFNIHPNLVLPDVTTSILRDRRMNETSFVIRRTTDHNLSHYSKYWNLRFAAESSGTSDNISYKKNIINFDEIAANSPSHLYITQQPFEHFN